MSSSDYLDGMAYAQARARRMRGGVDAAIADWRAYSEALLGKLQEAEAGALRNGAQLAGRNAQQQALRTALAALEPEHPLLALLPQLGNAAAADYLAEHGYDYDVASGQITPNARDEGTRQFGR